MWITSGKVSGANLKMKKGLGVSEGACQRKNRRNDEAANDKLSSSTFTPLSGVLSL